MLVCVGIISGFEVEWRVGLLIKDDLKISANRSYVCCNDVLAMYLKGIDCGIVDVDYFILTATKGLNINNN